MLERYRNVIFAVISIAIVSGIVVLLTYKPAPVVITINPPGPTNTPLPIRVYITGAVQSPLITYELPAGSRVEDAITAAGGATSDADLARINLAQVLQDGAQVNIPGKSTAVPQAENVIMPTPDGTTTKAATPPEHVTSTAPNIPNVPININTATLDELQLLPGVGPVLAQRIIDYRTQNGLFKSFEDLDKVEGVGESRLEQWKELIVFN